MTIIAPDSTPVTDSQNSARRGNTEGLPEDRRLQDMERPAEGFSSEGTKRDQTGLSSQPGQRVKFLLEPTSHAWIEQAIANLDTVLLDHSHCERKAASAALNLMFRYPSSQKLVKMLTAIAREELEHFDLVNRWLERRGVPLAPLNAPPYGAGLKAQVRRAEPQRMLDFLLVCGLIEARSHERLGLLAEYCPDRELAQFYRSLMASEARHYGVYWVLADTYFDREELDCRLQELAVVESKLLSVLHPEPRIHS